MHPSITVETKFLFLVRKNNLLRFCLGAFFLSTNAWAQYSWLPVKRPYQPPALSKEDSPLRPPYVSPGESSWAEDLFTEKLIADFYRRYEELFGAVESLRLIRSFPVDYYQYTVDSLTFREEVVEENVRMIRLGEYIFLKTLEHQLDYYLRSQPHTKEIYNAKERLTNVDMGIGPRGKAKLKYSISGNYLEAQYTFETFLISYRSIFHKLDENLFQVANRFWLLDYSWSQVYFFRLIYYVEESSYSLILRRHHGAGFTTSLTLNRNRSLPNTSETEDSFLLGVAFYLFPKLN